MILPRRFEFDRDTFAFRNELHWSYHGDPQTGKLRMSRCQPPPAYAHRCFVLVRSARQFLYHARFELDQPPPDAPACRRIIQEIVRRNPRYPSPPAERVLIPGYANLRQFSQAQETLLKGGCGAAWESYMLRSHWRMVFPIFRRHQARMAERLLARIEAGGVPIVHLVRFPQLTINHGLLLFQAESDPNEIRFQAYDPNLPQHPVTLTYHPRRRTFEFPPNLYWLGGRVDVFEIYCGWLF